MQERVVSRLKRDEIAAYIAKGERPDGRKLDETREPKIEVNVIERADGSAKVRLGNTVVLAAVKSDLGEPFEDTPDSGVLTVNAEFLPLASPTFEPGPPDENSIELARIVDRGLRESKCIELEKLCLISGEKVWVLWIDVYILDYGGNLFDAANQASLAALMTARIPETSVEKGEVKISDEKAPVPMRDAPISLTMAKIGGTLLPDPSPEEEQVMDCRVTMTLTNGETLCATQKGLGGVLTAADVSNGLTLARKISKRWREQLLAVVKANG